jgi:hypothetical protein
MNNRRQNLMLDLGNFAIAVVCYAKITGEMDSSVKLSKFS